MTVKELAKQYPLTVLSEEGLDNVVEGGYAGDLLSFVMAHAKEHMVWLTIQGHINSVAVASLVGVSAIILTEKSMPTPDMLEKAKENAIPILTTPLTSFNLAYLLGRDGMLGGEG
ncbi:MAG: DRTGG domain-containing protein [Niameybacter sp.]|uniref:DRTGG domain-containing protein n=1 Tax=Niameybacter sp. TaxID=2033640 RepID=UPI002FC5EF15